MKRRIFWTGFVLLFFLTVFFGGPYWVGLEIQKRIKIKVSGEWILVPLTNVFYLNDTAFEWENKVELISADLKVTYHYNPVSGNRIRLRIQNQSPVTMRLLGEWAAMQGSEKVTINQLKVDVALDPKGLAEIFEIHADSPAFQFHINKSEK